MYARWSLLLLLGQAINGALAEDVPKLKPIKNIAFEPAALTDDVSINPRSVLDLSVLEKRQNNCPGCTTEYCCQDGTCVDDVDANCCGDGFACGSSEQCCLEGCIPGSAQCCKGGKYCDKGYDCYFVADLGGDLMCCPDGVCNSGGLEDPERENQPSASGSIGGGGGGSSGPSPTSSGSSSGSYYTTTITVYLYPESTTSIISAQATDSLDAQLSFIDMSSSIASSLSSQNDDLLTTAMSSPTSNAGGGFGSGGDDFGSDFDFGSDLDFSDIPDVGNIGGGGLGGYPFPVMFSGSTTVSLFRTGFGGWYTAVYAGMIIMPALLAIII